MDVLRINYCVGLILDLFGFNTRSLIPNDGYLFYFIICKTLFKKDTFSSKFHDNHNVNREVQYIVFFMCELPFSMQKSYYILQYWNIRSINNQGKQHRMLKK